MCPGKNPFNHFFHLFIGGKSNRTDEACGCRVGVVGLASPIINPIILTNFTIRYKGEIYLTAHTCINGVRWTYNEKTNSWTDTKCNCIKKTYPKKSNIKDVN